MKTIGKVLLAVGLLAVLGFAGLMLVGGEADDYDYAGQVRDLTGKLGYDNVSVEVSEVEKGSNVLGVSIINVIGTFVDGDGSHEFFLNCSSDHEPDYIKIDGSMIMLDHLGEAAYNFAFSDLDAVPDKTFGGMDYPEEGKRFVLMDVVVKNLGHADGLEIRAPELMCVSGDSYEYDWDATFDYSDTYPTDLKLGQGNEYRYQLVFEIQKDAEPDEARWDTMYIDMHGYVRDSGLKVVA